MQSAIVVVIHYGTKNVDGKNMSPCEKNKKNCRRHRQGSRWLQKTELQDLELGVVM